MNITPFTFNPFQENTYVLFDKTKECVIIDPGCNNETERQRLTTFIEENDLKPVHLINTHCHIDHVLGNKFVADKYDLELTSHEGEKAVLYRQPSISNMYGIPYMESPEITITVADGDEIRFGEQVLKVLYTPGHSPASISLYNAASKSLIAGDVLFRESIGRTDLPGGDMQTLLTSIRDQFFILPEDVKVYPGHGLTTTIGHEKENNPFFR